MVDDATRVRAIRAILGLSSHDFAAKLGVSSTTLTNWSKGRSIPNAKGRKALAKVMNRGKIILLENGMPVPKGTK